MFIPESYTLAIFLCFLTMLCWGSWVNTQKLTSKEWPFPLFYWDYSLGTIFLAVLFGLTLGSFGAEGRSFLADLAQGNLQSYSLAFLSGTIFNLSNLLIVAAIDIAGMAVAFPMGVGIAMVLGVIVNYVANPIGNPFLLFTGVGLVTLAIILDALAYQKLNAQLRRLKLANAPLNSPPQTSNKFKKPRFTINKGFLLSILGGILMGFFYRFLAASISPDFANPTVGMFTPYSGIFVFSIGIFISNFLWNSFFMYKPVKGRPVSYRDYFTQGNLRLHLIGLLGGIIFCVGTSLNLIASEKAGFAISYGLGQGGIMVGAAWGIFIWKEFAQASKATYRLMYLMFLTFIAGLTLIILARVI